MPISGESGTLSFYLALLSAYHQKPISKEVAATGFVDVRNYSQFNYCPWCLREEIKNNPEKIFFKHKISSVGGLEYKVPAAVQAGAKKLILSTEQKKDYEKNVPQGIREKLKVYYVKNVEELERLF
jgi:ATP-dependent Lon protease